MSGKGSTPRPLSVPKESFDEAFDRIFGKNEEPKNSPVDQETEDNGQKDEQ